MPAARTAPSWTRARERTASARSQHGHAGGGVREGWCQSSNNTKKALPCLGVGRFEHVCVICTNITEAQNYRGRFIDTFLWWPCETPTRLRSCPPFGFPESIQSMHHLAGIWLCQGADGTPQRRRKLYSHIQPAAPPSTAVTTPACPLRRGTWSGQNRLSRAHLRQHTAVGSTEPHTPTKIIVVDRDVFTPSVWCHCTLT